MTVLFNQPAGVSGRLHDMRRGEALRRLFELSELHLSLALEELWDRWETVAARKLELQRAVMCLGGSLPLNPQERFTLKRILELENRMISLLKAKRKRIAEEIHETMDSAKPAAASKSGRLLRVRC